MNASNKPASLLEEITNREHEQWSHWMKYLFSKCIEEHSDNKAKVKTGNLIIPRELVERWMRQMSTPYSDLSDEEKKSDIAEAIKVLEIIKHRHEYTKGVSIPCRDCGKVLSVLTTESAKILAARCPKCHKAFQKKGEEHNLEIGYTRQGEALSPLALSTLADNGSFGLEKWLMGIKDEKAKELLRDGVAFCDFLINTKDDSVAKQVKETLLEIIGGRIPDITEPEARAMQAFFNSESVPMLKSVLTQQLSRERRR